MRTKTVRRLSLHVGPMCLLLSVFCTVITCPITSGAAAPDGSTAAGEQQDSQPAPPSPQFGLITNEAKAFQGYTLVFPLSSTNTYLIDMQGRVVQTWKSKYMAGQEAYLLENGHLLRPCNVSDDEAFFAGMSKGGRIQEFTWDGELVWDYKFHNKKQIRHHAVTRMPNGNIMMIVWERKTPKESTEAGVKPEFAGGETLVDSLYEVQPAGKTGGKIVWEWHMWDHLIQDQDKSKANYGDVAAHPELADVNFGRNSMGGFGGGMRFGPPPAPAAQPDNGAKNDPKSAEIERLKGLGYVGAGAAGKPKFEGLIPDWTHVNSVAYNAKFDQILISVREFSEVWILDHGTSTAQAAGHAGGKYGKGGDILFRWGNPRAYRAGTESDQRLFAQHDAQWIPDGLPGAGHLLIFSNGGGRPNGNYSSVEEVAVTVDANGIYPRQSAKAFGPDQALWSYSSPSDFFAPFMGSAQRLANGNTLLCTGFSGEIFEVTPEKQVVWKYITPQDPGVQPGGFGPPGGFGGPPGGPPQFNGPARSVQLLPGPLSFMLQFTDEQRMKLEEFEKDASTRFDKILTADQKKQLDQARNAGGPFGAGAGGSPELGRILPDSVQETLKFTDSQKSQMGDLQKAASDKLDATLNDDQKKQMKDLQEMIKNFAPGGPGGGPGPGGPPGGRTRRTRRGGGGPGFGPPGGGPGGFGGMGMGNALFRAYRYAPDYPGLAGKILTPGKPIEQLEPKKPAGN